MRFLTLLEKLRKSYEHSSKLTENGVALLGVTSSPPPLAKHYVFPPMPPEVRQYLLDSYKRSFPSELLEIYSVANGMNLFWKDGTLPNGRVFPFSCLAICGYPVGPLRVQLQPYNITIEDTSRLPKTPESYLKFGFYKKIENLRCETEYELFIDTDNGSVCAANRGAKEFCAEERWASVDDCLCCLFERLAE